MEVDDVLRLLRLLRRLRRPQRFILGRFDVVNLGDVFRFVLENGRQRRADAGRRFTPRRQRLTRLRHVVPHDARRIRNGTRIRPLLHDPAVRIGVVSVVSSVSARHSALKFIESGQRRAGQTALVAVLPRRRRRRRRRRFALPATQSTEHSWRFFHNSLRDGFQSIFQISSAATTGAAGVVSRHSGRTTLAGFLDSQFHVLHALEDVVQTGRAPVFTPLFRRRRRHSNGRRQRRQRRLVVVVGVVVPFALLGQRHPLQRPTRVRRQRRQRRHCRSQSARTCPINTNFNFNHFNCFKCHMIRIRINS